MKILGWKCKVFKSPSRLCVFWLLVLMVAIGATGNGQSPALTECTRAFYGEDYAMAIQMAEKHLSKYPKDMPVRVVLARAELAQGKHGQEPLGRAYPWDICSDASLPFELPLHSPHHKKLAYIRLAPVTGHFLSPRSQP